MAEVTCAATEVEDDGGCEAAEAVPVGRAAEAEVVADVWLGAAAEEAAPPPHWALHTWLRQLVPLPTRAEKSGEGAHGS